MSNEILLAKEIINILSNAGIPKGEFRFWSGVSNLNFSAYGALAQYLGAATREEIKNFNSLLKQKISILKSGDETLWQSLISQEKQMIFQ